MTKIENEKFSFLFLSFSGGGGGEYNQKDPEKLSMFLMAFFIQKICL